MKANIIIEQMDIKIYLKWIVFLIDIVEFIKIESPKNDRIILAETHKNKISEKTRKSELKKFNIWLPKTKINIP